MGPVKEAGPADLKACLACCCLHGCWDIAPSQRPSLPPSILGLWWPLTPQPLRSSLCMRQSEDCETCPRQEPRAKAGTKGQSRGRTQPKLLIKGWQDLGHTQAASPTPPPSSPARHVHFPMTRALWVKGAQVCLQVLKAGALESS